MAEQQYDFSRVGASRVSSPEIGLSVFVQPSINYLRERKLFVVLTLSFPVKLSEEII